MMPKITIRPVTPTSARRGCAFVTREDGCGVEERDFPTYPPSPRGEELRQARVAAGLYTGELARLLRVSASDVSGLERGRYDTDEWAYVFAVIEESKQ